MVWGGKWVFWVFKMGSGYVKCMLGCSGWLVGVCGVLGW